MMRTLWSAASGMLAQQLNIDTISNNLANVSTTGYKKSRVEFQDLLYQTIRPSGVPLSTGTQTAIGVQVGTGTKPVAIQKLFTQGETTITNNPLDLEVDGDGFFQVSQPDGTIAYTRDGSFNQDAAGHIVTPDGNYLQPEISIPQDITSVSISSEGKVFGTVPGQTDQSLLGEIELVKFVNPAGLNALGGNLYAATSASGEPIQGVPGVNGFGSIAQGSLENSNVQVVEEMVNMIISQRAYEVNAKAITTADQMLSLANNLRGQNA